jgi:hypothetical protein
MGPLGRLGSLVLGLAVVSTALWATERDAFA